MVERARLEQTENGLVPSGEDAPFDRGGTGRMHDAALP
jgi:hypothetical protein